MGKKQLYTPCLLHFLCLIFSLIPRTTSLALAFLFFLLSCFLLRDRSHAASLVCVLPFLTTAPHGVIYRLADFLPKFIPFRRWCFLGCLLPVFFSQSVAELDRFSAAATERPSLLSVPREPSLAGYGRVGGELMQWESKVPFAFHGNGIPELFDTCGEGFSLSKLVFGYVLLHWLHSNSLSNVWLNPLVAELGQLWHTPSYTLKFLSWPLTHTHKEAMSGQVNSAPVQKATVVHAQRYF